MSVQTLHYKNVDTGSVIDETQRPYGKCLLNGIPLFMASLLMMILFFHENIEASIICFTQQYVNKVIM